MGRLINADNLQFNGRNYNKSQMKAILDFIDSQPTAYDPDKVVEQLENERKFWEHAYDKDLGKEKARSYAHAIEIVEGGGVDAN